MPSKMVANFRRSLSFPNQPSSSSSSTKLIPKKKTYHVRSTSLPCRSHPLISQLKDEINELKSSAFWAKPVLLNLTSSANCLCHGLSQLRNVQESLDDLLQLPQTRESLRRPHHELVDKFLDDFLHLVDVYGIFQTLLLTLKQEHSAAQVAVRRRDDSKISFYLKNSKRIAKDLAHLVKSSAVQCMAAAARTDVTIIADDQEDHDADEIAQVIRNVIQVTASFTVALFNGLSVSLAALQKRPSSSSSLGLMIISLLAKTTNISKKGDVVMIEGGIRESQQVRFGKGLQRKSEDEVKLTSKLMQELEERISGIESGGESVFRSLINTRVSLLNVLTH